MFLNSKYKLYFLFLLLGVLNTFIKPVAAQSHSTHAQDIPTLLLKARQSSNIDSTLFFYKKASSIAKTQQKNAELAPIEWLIGKTYRKQQKYKTAQTHLDIALALLQNQSKDTLYLNVLDELTATNYWLHISEDAMKYAAEGLNLAETMDNTRYQRIFLQWFGRVFEIQAQWEEALEYYEKVLSLSMPTNDADLLFNAYLNLACTHYKKGDAKLGLNYLADCKPFAAQLPNRAEQLAVSELWEGLMQDQLANHSEAEQLFKKVIPVFDSLNIPNRRMHARLALGQVFLNQQKLAEAANMAEEVLNLDPEHITIYEKRYAYNQLYIAYKYSGNYNQALQNLELHNKESAYLDSLNNNKTINELEAKYNEREQQQQIDQQAILLKLQQKNQTYFLMALVFLGLLLLGTFFIIHFLNRTRNSLASQNVIIRPVTD